MFRRVLLVLGVAGAIGAIARVRGKGEVAGRPRAAGASSTGPSSDEPPMTVALVVGAGEVGTRAVRQLVDTPGFATVLLADRDCRARAASADALGPSVHAIEYTPGDAIPPDVAVIACALPAGVGHDVVAAAIAAGVPVASSDDEHDAIEQLRALDPERARRRA